MATPRVVLVHDWLTGLRGGEKCLEEVCQRFPDAPLYTLLRKHGSVSETVEKRPIHTSPLQWFPGVSRYYRYLLPLMPAAAACWRLPPCDLVISFSHCVAKAALPPAEVPHLCYCFTPMRYAWHMRQAYFANRVRGLKARAVDALMAALRDWDRRTALRVTHFVAISRTVRDRIRECYGRDSCVIYPPVDTDFYCPAPVPRENYYLVVSAFAPYKRVDLAIEACRKRGIPLVVIGTGQDEGRLRSLSGNRVTFLGWQPNSVIRDHMRRCKALLFPGEEDFGIVPVEAMSCGAPVIALNRGGATETVVPREGRTAPTGILFDEQSADALADTLERFERTTDIDPAACRRQALRFHPGRYRNELFTLIDEVLSTARESPRRIAPPDAA